MENTVAPPPFPWASQYQYSQAVAAGDLVFAAGQGGFGEDGGVVEGGFEAQLRQAFANLDAALRGAGASLETIVKLTVFLADRADYPIFRRVRAEVLTPPWPAATAVGSALLIDGMLVEVEAVAVRGTPRTAA